MTEPCSQCETQAAGCNGDSGNKRCSEMWKWTNLQQTQRIERGLFGGNAPAPQLWRRDESMSADYSTSNNTNISALLLGLVRCAEEGKKIHSHSLTALLFVISHITASLARCNPQICVFLLCSEACTMSQLRSCVQLVGEMFLWISVLPNRLGQERRGAARNSKTGLSFPSNTVFSNCFILL